MLRARDNWGSVILVVVSIKWYGPCLCLISSVKEDFLNFFVKHLPTTRTKDFFSVNSNGSNIKKSHVALPDVAVKSDSSSNTPKHLQILITIFSYSCRSTLHTLMGNGHLMGSRPSGFQYLYHVL